MSSGLERIPRSEFLRRCSGWPLATTLLPLLGACSRLGTSSAPSSRYATKSGYPAISASVWPAYVAADEGLFAKYGLDVSQSYVEGSPNLLAAIQSKEMPVAWNGGDAVVNFDRNGADVVVFATVVPRVVAYVYSKPDVTSPEQLRGTAIAAGARGAPLEVIARAALTRLGLKPDTDLKMLQTQGSPANLAALQAGAVAAAVVAPPANFAAAAAGFRLLVDVTAMNIPTQNGLASTRSFIQARRDVALAYLKTIVDAIHFIKTQPARSKEILGKYSHTTDAAILDGSYNIYAPIFPRVPTVSQESIENAMSNLPAGVSPRPWADYVDLSLVQQLQDEGFIDKTIYGV